MRAFLVPETGEVIYPVTLPAGKGLGDGMAPAAPGSEEARRWALFAQPLPPRLRPALERLRAAQAGRRGAANGDG